MFGIKNKDTSSVTTTANQSSSINQQINELNTAQNPLNLNPRTINNLHTDLYTVNHNEDSHYSKITKLEDIKNQGFKDEKGLKRILEFSGIDKNTETYATVSEPTKERFHVVMDGPEVAAKFFAGALSRFNPINILKGHDNQLGTKLFNKGDKLNILDPQNKNPHQSLKEIQEGLKSGRLKAVINYELDKTTGKWNFNKPFAIDLIENYAGAANDILDNKLKNIPRQFREQFKPALKLAANNPQYKKTYVFNLSLVDEDTKRYNQTLGEVQKAATALAEAMPEGSTFIVPNSVHNNVNGQPEAFTTSKFKQSIEIPWQHIELVGNDKKEQWQVVQHPLTIFTDKGVEPVFDKNFPLIHNLHRLQQLDPKSINDKNTIEMLFKTTTNANSEFAQA